MNFLEANGLRFAYLTEGQGPLVLLVHGFPDTAHTWREVMPALAAKGYRAVAPFLRGYAPSGLPARDTDALTLAHDVVALIDALGEKDATLIGHDWGASAVYGATSLAPHKVRRLFALAIPHPATLKPTLGKLWGVRHMLAFKLPGAAHRFAREHRQRVRALYRRWSPTWAVPEDEFAAIDACFSDARVVDAALGYYRALSPRLPRELTQKTAVPTVAFCGADDPNTDRQDFERGRSRFTGPYAVEVMPGGHFLHREHPRVFLERLLSHFP